MTIQERLRRSNLVMLVVPVVIAGVLFAAGLGALALLLNAVYLPRLGLTFQDLHSIGEEMEQVFRGLKLFVVLYAAVVLAALLAAVAITAMVLPGASPAPPSCSSRGCTCPPFRRCTAFCGSSLRSFRGCVRWAWAC